MSQNVSVDMSAVRSMFDTLRVLIPKGEESMPVGMYVKDGKMIVVCVQGCVYQAVFMIDDTTVSAEATILYRDISPLLSSSGSLEFEFDSTHVSIYGEGFTVECPMAYSVVEPVEFKDVKFVELTSSIYAAGLKTILSLGLDKLYNKVVPITVRDNIATQQFPNVFVQVRASGLPVKAVLDVNHIQLITRFYPNAVSLQDSNSLLFRNNSSYLQIPCKPVNTELNALSLLEGMESVTKFNAKSYLDRLRSMAKLWSKDYCKVSLFEEGIKTTLTQSQVSVLVDTGNCNTRVVGVFELPTQLWLSILKGVGTEFVEVLYGGEKVCLRTPFTIIVTRVLR